MASLKIPNGFLSGRIWMAKWFVRVTLVLVLLAIVIAFILSMP